MPHTFTVFEEHAHHPRKARSDLSFWLMLAMGAFYIQTGGLGFLRIHDSTSVSMVHHFKRCGKRSPFKRTKAKTVDRY